jgi:hemoglobin
MTTIDKTLFDRIGGFDTLEKVHKIFYDKAFSHPWLKQYFTERPQSFLENQQTDFMGQLMGGPKRYAGKNPKMAHQHINITEDLFRLRQFMLNEAIIEYGLADELRKEWMRADASIKMAIIKKSVDECSTSRPTQEILDFPKPDNLELFKS